MFFCFFRVHSTAPGFYKGDEEGGHKLKNREMISIQALSFKRVGKENARLKK